MFSVLSLITSYVSPASSTSVLEAADWNSLLLGPVTVNKW